MKRVLTAVVLIPLVVLAVFRAPYWLFSLLVGVVALAAMLEYLAIVERYGIPPFRKLTIVFVMLAFIPFSPGLDRIGTRPLVEVALGIALLWAPFVFLILAMATSDLKSALPAAATSLLGLPYIVLPLLLLVVLRALSNGRLWILLLFVVVWSGDIAAFYIGSLFGKHPLASRISPKKTWEGAVASVVAGSLLGTLILTNLPRIAGGLAAIGLLPSVSVLSPGTATTAVASLPVSTAVVLSLLTNVAAQFGDLVESMMKRGASIKDSGAILPGHGGVLDRIDALLFAVPVVWYYAVFHGIFPLQP